MDKEIRHILKVKNVREMKSPVIVMNTKDFDCFKKEIESKMVNFEVGVNPTYEGIPIITKDHIEQGNVFIYDDVTRNFN